MFLLYGSNLETTKTGISCANSYYIVEYIKYVIIKYLVFNYDAITISFGLGEYDGAGKVKHHWHYPCFPVAVACSIWCMMKIRSMLYSTLPHDECQDLKESFLPAIQRKYGPRVEMALLEISQLENYRTLLAIEKQSGRFLDKTPPLVIVGKDVLAGGQEQLKIWKQLSVNIKRWGCDWPRGWLADALPEPTEQLGQIGYLLFWAQV